MKQSTSKLLSMEKLCVCVCVCVCVKLLSHVQLFATPWTVARQDPLSMGFSRQEYWSGLPFPSPWDLPNPGIEPGSPALQAGFFTTSATWQARAINKSLLVIHFIYWSG